MYIFHSSVTLNPDRISFIAWVQSGWRSPLGSDVFGIIAGRRSKFSNGFVKIMIKNINNNLLFLSVCQLCLDKLFPLINHNLLRLYITLKICDKDKISPKYFTRGEAKLEYVKK